MGTGDERFGLSWSGKAASRALAADGPTARLRVDTERSFGVAPCHDRFIEGDNLLVMRALRATEAASVKVAYLDPPYNTGNPNAYNDSFVTGERTDPGDRSHAAWLSMMLPRLMLVRDLLRDEGVVFVSIDDNELANLRLLMDEVFGSANFVSIIHWKKRGTGGQHANAIVNQIEYVLCYAKDAPRLRLSGPPSPRAGHARWRDFRKSGGQWQRRFRPKQHFALWADESGRVAIDEFEHSFPVHPQDAKGEDGFWENGVPTTAQRISAGELRARLIRGRWKIEQLEVAKPTRSAGNLVEIPSTRATHRLRQLLGAAVFENPKPVELIEHLLDLADPQDADIVLDPFAGSCTTAEAVVSWRTARGRAITYTMVNSAEPVRLGSEAHEQGYRTVSQIGLARIGAMARTVPSALDVFVVDDST